MSWIFEGKELSYIPPEAYGFVYLITRKDTGRIYVGKKALTHRKKKVLSKKARKTTRKRTEITRVDSGWKDYYGSSEELKAEVQSLGKDKFVREIICFCNSKAELSYYEGHFMYKHRVFFVDSYNKWINVKVYRFKFDDKDKFGNPSPPFKGQGSLSGTQRNTKTAKPSKKPVKKGTTKRHSKAV